MLNGARVADALKVLIGEYPYIEKVVVCDLRFDAVNLLKRTRYAVI